MALLVLAAPSARADDSVVVAVADFDVANDGALAPLGKGLAQMLITDLSAADAVRLVERARLQEVLHEVELEKSPYFDPRGAARLGKGLGAELIVTGQVFAEAAALRVDVRAIDVETGEVVYAGKVEGERARIFELQKTLAAEVLAGLGAKLSPIGKKQIGKHGTKSFEAMSRFGAALDAEDRGDGAALRSQLALALRADPEFGAARDRLNALEERVGTLERSGGLILAPSSWRDHLHNFKTHRANSDLVQAERSLVAALALEPRRAELWTAFADLPLERGQAAIVQARLDAASKQALRAHLTGDLGAFQAAPESAENPAFRSVLAIDLIGRRLRAFTLTAAVELERATSYLLDPGNRSAVEPMLVDTEAFFSLARNLKRERLEGRDPPSRWLAEMIAGGSDGKSDGASSAWEIELLLAERPAGPLDVRLTKLPLPPGDKPYPNDGLWESKLARDDDPKRSAAVRSGRAYGWYVNPGTDPFARGGIRGYAPFGQSFQIPDEDKFFECEPATRSPTGQRCVVLLTLQKLSVTPGPYRFEVRYRDAAGGNVELRMPRFWIWEFKLAEFKTGLWMNMDPWYLINPIDDRVRERLGAAGPGAAMVALACANPPMSSGKKSPLATIYYDADFGLLNGRPIASGDAAAWQRYRALMTTKGRAIKPHRDDGCGYVPLPKLTPGVHTLCLVAGRTDGSRTLEPECLDAEVPAHYPQEGRKPR